AIRDCFRFDPKVFRNTELIYSDETGQAVKDLGFEGIYVDGIESLLRGASANQVYAHPSGGMILFPRNYKLSDDIAFRYSDPTWSEWPLTSETFLRWINQMPSSAFTCLGMDYETLGEHQKRTGGILEFMEGLLTGLAQQKRISFINPSEAQGKIMPVATLSAQGTISWADHERDVSAWLGNEMQRDAFDSLRKLLPKIVRSADSKLLRDCRYLQTSDHFYYMSTKGGSDGQVHQYFSPYNSPYEAFMNYMNVLSDIAYRLKTGELKTALNTAIGTAL
ncbi:MAG TPA: alpha-amylase, partial [Chryseosolibacter sp.]|nr:alpha-amylase [Chryseosolibacter sp.]